MKKLNPTHLLLALTLMFFLFAYTSCTSGKKENNDESNIDSTGITDTEPAEVPDIEINMDEYPVPLPFQISETLQEAGVEYDYQYSNSNQNIYKYKDDAYRAMNIGVYGADLSVANVYNEIQETQAYISSLRELADELQLPESFDSEKIEQYITNHDTLKEVITQSYYKKYSILASKEQSDLAALMIAGCWVENMYHATQMLDKAEDRKPVEDVLNQQGEVATKIMAMLKKHADKNQTVLSLKEKIHPVFTIYENREDKLTDNQIDKIKNAIADARNFVIKEE